MTSAKSGCLIGIEWVDGSKVNRDNFKQHRLTKGCTSDPRGATRPPLTGPSFPVLLRLPSAPLHLSLAEHRPFALRRPAIAVLLIIVAIVEVLLIRQLLPRRNIPDRHDEHPAVH